MGYKDVECDCGRDVEIFISQASESNGREECECGRVIQYKSPEEEGITETNITYEVGDVQSNDFD